MMTTTLPGPATTLTSTGRRLVVNPLSALTLVAIAALLQFPDKALGAITSAGAATRAFPKKSGAEVLPPFYVRPFDEVLYSWGFQYDATTNTEYLVSTFNVSIDQWVAVGFSSYKKMNGSIAVAYLSANGLSAIADDYYGDTKYNIFHEDYNWSTPTSAGITISPSSVNAFIRFRTVIGVNVGPPANGSNIANYSYPDARSYGGVPDDTDTFVRVIFATGLWQDGDARAVLKQHSAENAYTCSINWRTGAVTQLTSNMYQYILYEMGGVAVIILCIAFFERHYNAPRAPWRRSVYAGLAGVAFVACVAQFIAVRYLDYIEMVKPKPQIRCFGDAIVLLMAFLTIPVGKRVVFSNLFAVSHERAIKYHAFIAWLMIICGAVHGLGMLYYYGADCFTWASKDEQSHLPGVIAYVLLLLTVVPAALRHKAGWNTFRATHYLYVLVYFFSVLHFPPTAYALIPGAVVHIFALAVKQLVVTQGVSENLDSVSFDEPSGILTIDVARNDFIVCGTWFTICFPEISSLQQHPFSVAKLLLLNDGNVTIMRFFVKVSPNPNSWTARVAERVKETQQKNPKDTQVFKSIRCNGPLGMFEVSPKNYRHIALLCGGIGITQHLLMLQHVLISDRSSVGETSGKLSVTLIWAVRTAAELEIFVHDLHSLRQRMESTHKHVLFTLRIFVTCPDVPDNRAELAPNPYIQLLNIEKHKRPDFGVELDKVTVALERHTKLWSAKIGHLQAEERKRYSAGMEGGGGEHEMKSKQSSHHKKRQVDDPLALLDDDEGVEGEAEPDISPSLLQLLDYSVATYISGPPSFVESAQAAIKEPRNGFAFHAHVDTYRI